MDLLLGIKLLLLLFAANGAPIVATRLMGARWDRAVDGGYRMPDGQPLLGPSKTWRGIAAAFIATPVLAMLLGLPVTFGVTVAALAMLGDLLSSFTKRRLRIPSSGMAFGLDQIPESLLPLLAAQQVYQIGWMSVALLTLAFLVLELLLSRVLYQLRIRKRPY